MAGRGAGNGTPGGRRSATAHDERRRDNRPGRSGGRGAGRGRTGGRPRCGSDLRSGTTVRQRRRDGSGSLDTPAKGTAGEGKDPTAVLSPAPATIPIAVPRADTESRRRVVARLTAPEACLGCGACVDDCPASAIDLTHVVEIREDLCTGCGACVETCPHEALTLVAA